MAVVAVVMPNFGRDQGTGEGGSSMHPLSTDFAQLMANGLGYFVDLCHIRVARLRPVHWRHARFGAQRKKRRAGTFMRKTDGEEQCLPVSGMRVGTGAQDDY